jgi:phosphopantothenoylcysteine synthetase/decarboxylase
MREVLLVGGAPRVSVDAVRYLTVAASGNTAVELQRVLSLYHCLSTLLLGLDANPAAVAQRYQDRAELERALQLWIKAHSQGVIVLSAAINDYTVAQITSRRGTNQVVIAPGQKLPSGADEVTLQLKPATKVIDQLRDWGHRGPLVAFKYEDRETVIQSALALRKRVNATLVVANSLCGQVQAIISEGASDSYADRASLMKSLSQRILTLAQQ